MRIEAASIKNGKKCIIIVIKKEVELHLYYISGGRVTRLSLALFLPN